MNIDKIKILFELERYAETVNLCKKSASSAVSLAAIWYCAASFIQLDQHKEAIHEIKNGLQHWPHDPTLHRLLATAYSSIGLYDKAEKSCRVMLHYEPLSLEGNFLAAHILIYQGKYVDATTHIQQIFKQDPDYFNAHLLMAQIYYYTDQKKRCEKAVSRALELDPNNSEALNFLSRLKAKRVDTTGLLKKALLHSPTDKGLQKRYKSETKDRQQAICIGIFFAVILVGFRLYAPSSIQEAGAPVLRFLVVSTLIYYSRFFVLSFLLSFSVATVIAFLDGDTFQSGWATGDVFKIFSILVAYAIIAFLAVLIALLLRTLLTILLLWLKEKRELYKKQKKAGQLSVSFESAIKCKRTWLIIIGALLVPLVNCVGYFAPSRKIFWSTFMISFLIVAGALFFLADVKKITVVIQSTLFYAFCVIGLTIFWAALAENVFFVIPGIFTACLIGTLVALSDATDTMESIYLKKRRKDKQSM